MQTYNTGSCSVNLNLYLKYFMRPLKRGAVRQIKNMKAKQKKITRLHHAIDNDLRIKRFVLLILFCNIFFNAAGIEGTKI